VPGDDIAASTLNVHVKYSRRGVCHKRYSPCGDIRELDITIDGGGIQSRFGCRTKWIKYNPPHRTGVARLDRPVGPFDSLSRGILPPEPECTVIHTTGDDRSGSVEGHGSHRSSTLQKGGSRFPQFWVVKSHDLVIPARRNQASIGSGGQCVDFTFVCVRHNKRKRRGQAVWRQDSSRQGGTLPRGTDIRDQRHRRRGLTRRRRSWSFRGDWR
jgi:hypothetical protein